MIQCFSNYLLLFFLASFFLQLCKLKMQYNQFFIHHMKTRYFKITKLAPIESKRRQASIKRIDSGDVIMQPNIGSSPVKEQMGKSENFIGLIEDTIRKQLKITSSRIEMEARDCFIQLPLPHVEDNEQSLSDQALEEWMTDICNSVFSAAFNFFSKDQMSLDYTKIFCSECILRNIYRLTQKFSLDKHQMRVLNKHLQRQIVPYMQRKYPLTESYDVNKAIDECVRPIDNRQAMTNDLLQKTGILFTWRESGDYSDLIMKLLNWLMTDIDTQNDEDNENDTPYEEFYSTMSDLFENVFDERWMKSRAIQEYTGLNLSQRNQMKMRRIQTLPVEQKISQDRYASKVKDYTNYAIGRKISKSTPVYTDQEIINGHLNIKSSSILRILTKWCEELWNKFTTKNYFLDREQNMRVQQVGGNVNTMFMWMKEPLNDMMEKEKRYIQSFMKDVTEHNFDQQSLLLLKELQRDGFTHVEKIERACGKYANKTVNNLHCYIVLYLNRVIHGLLTVSKELYQTKLSSKNRWTAPPDLMSFKIGDIMRCKCSSKERQILKIFKQLERICDEDNSPIKIIRIKNRLKMGTNDILINVMFKQKFICQIQLAVKSATSKFIQCSNMFSHYVYELGRTLFGPITQLCSVWMSLDTRSLEYERIVSSQKRKHSKNSDFGCKINNEEHYYEVLQRPFICNDCRIAYSSTNYIWTHRKCQKCDHMICARCRIQNESDAKLKDDLLQGQTQVIREAANMIVNRRFNVLPQFGLCVKINDKKVKVQKFRKLEIKNILSVYGVATDSKGNQKIYLIKDLMKPTDEQKFLKNYLVFEIHPFQGEMLINITTDKARKQYMIPEKVKDIYKKEKEIMSLIEEDLEDKDILIIKKEPKRMEKIKNMELADNKLTQISFIADHFPNLNRLQLSRNIVSNIDNISKLTKLGKLNLRNNKLTKLPEEICQLILLRSLNIRHNQLEELPRNFGALVNMTKLEADNNKITVLPPGFDKLVKLHMLNLSKNKLSVFPDQVRNFKKIQTLKVASNKAISFIPEWINELESLQMLDMNSIGATNLPQTIFSMLNLTTLKVFSSCSELSPQVGQLKKLKELSLQMPNIKELPDTMLNLKELNELELEECKMDELPDFLSEMKKLQSFFLINNQVNSLSKEVSQMVRLQHLKIEHQNISDLPLQMQDLVELKTLSLNNNKFKRVPDLIRCYTKLYHFTMKNNQVEEIPENFFETLPALEVVDFSNNKLLELPFSLSQLKKIKKCTFEGNPELKQPSWIQIMTETVDKVLSQNIFMNMQDTLTQMF